MKFLIAFAAVATIAVAVPVQRALVSPGLAGPAPIVDENGSPIAIGPAVIDFSPISVGPAIVETSPISVGPAIAETSPISVGPAIVEANPIAVGPAIVDFPLPDGGALTAVEPTPVIQPSPVVQPSPVIVGEIPAGATPLVQIIVNVKQQESIVAPAPIDTPVIDEVHVPGPVNVVDNVIAPEPIVEPIVVVEPVIPGPVNVVDNVVVPVEPVQVVEPIVVEPVIVGTPIIPAPAVFLPIILN